MQQRFRLLIFLNQHNAFGRQIRPSSEALFDWYNAPPLLPTGVTVEMELNRGSGRQQRRCIVPKAVYTVKKCF
jgi:hypothetical protein